MAEDPFVTSSTQQPHIYRPIPRRNFSSSHTDAADSPAHAYLPSTPPGIAESQNRPSDFLAQLNARLLRTYNARLDDNQDADSIPPPRNKSLMTLTESTLSGIYHDDDTITSMEQSVPETPWGTGAESPGRKYAAANRWDSGADSPAFGLTMQPRTRNKTASTHAPHLPTSKHTPKSERTGLWKYAISLGKLAALFLFGVTYGVIVSHLHDTRELAAVRVEGVDRGSWIYLASWGLAGLVLGSCLPYAELVWGGRQVKDQGEEDEGEKESETSLSEQWNDIVRSVGAFLAIAFAIVSPHFNLSAIIELTKRSADSLGSLLSS